MSANDKTSLGYDSQLSENEMPKCEIFETAFDSSVSEIDEDNNQAKNRYKVGIGYHAVPLPYTGNYMPSRVDLSFTGLDDSMFKFKISKTRTSVNKNESIASKSSDDIREEPKTVRVDHQNLSKMTHPYPKKNFVPTAIATKSGHVLVNAAKQSSTASTSTTRLKVNTVAIRPNVNAKSSYFKPHFPKRRHFNQRSAAKTNTFSRIINFAKGKNVTTAGPKAIVNAAKGKQKNVVKSSACWIWRPKGKLIDHTSKDSGSYTLKRFNYGNPQYTLQDQGIFNSGCSRNMTGNKSFLTEYQEIDGGFVAFGGSHKGDFKLLDESQVLLKVPRQNNMYSFDLKNVVLTGDLTCLFAKAIIDESNLWHRRLGHINFKTLNKLVRGNLVRDHLGKFDGKADERFLVGYSVNSKAFRVFNSRTSKVKENLHVNFLERNQSNSDAGIQTDIHAGQASQEKAIVHEYILLLFIPSNPPLSSTIQSSDVNAGEKPRDVNAGDIQGDVDEISRNDDVCQGNEIKIDSSTHAVNAASPSINIVSNIIDAGSLNINTADFNHTNMPTL
nr:ribonuclease H-like domain-containing protein [Tanacetum cinerariifolium]